MSRGRSKSRIERISKIVTFVEIHKDEFGEYIPYCKKYAQYEGQKVHPGAIGTDKEEKCWGRECPYYHIFRLEK